MNSLVDVLIPPLQKPFTYELPERLEPSVHVGWRVTVPFGKRNADGFVIGKYAREAGASKEFEIKPVLQSEWSYPHFDPGQLRLFRWIADYYGYSLSSVIEMAVPPAVPQKFERTVALNAASDAAVRGTLQTAIVALLRERGGSAEWRDLAARFRGAPAALKQLTERGVVQVTQHEIIDRHLENGHAPEWAKGEVQLNAHQQTALQAITDASNRFETFVLHGVTGSGKTEVYLEAIRHVNRAGKGALIIVPEIALTPQLIDRFRARLGNELAVLHSGLQRRVRWDSWRALLERRNFVAIGARSGIFAPIANLGLIIVDEEHDTSYKQSEGLRYHARDLAIVRAKLESCPVVLGSATPSLETYFHAVSGKYRLLSLPARHAKNSALHIDLVDLNKVKPWDMPSKNISPLLHDALKEVLVSGDQAFVLYNRRGFASYLQCERCEQVVKCPNCSVTLTYHQRDHRLLCHYCNLSVVPPAHCSACSAALHGAKEGEQQSAPGKLAHRGAGTEKVFEELQQLFPGVPIDRLDRDAVSDLERYRAILDRVRSGETKILVGTQMIAKGHDLPGVTLVGIADCDVGLHMPDFRAGERVFQLLTQASGRAGRGERQGRVILQTRVPRHPSLVTTLSQDYEAFAREELSSRRALLYPPFSRVLRIIASSVDEQLPGQILHSFVQRIQEFLGPPPHEVRVLGPTPAPLEKLKAMWRWHLMLKGQSPAALLRIMKMLQSLSIKTTRVKIIFDMDPQEMM